MSAAKPLTSEARRAHYLAQTGRSDLTAAQRRRIIAKEHEAERVYGIRVGRLRRRHEAKLQYRLAAEARQVIALISSRKAALTYGDPAKRAKREARRRRYERGLGRGA